MFAFLRIELEVMPTSELTPTLEEAKKIAFRYGCPVSFKFNEFPIVVDHMSDLNDIANKYMKWVHRRERHNRKVRK